MSPPKVLFVNACASVEGDVAVMLLYLKHHDRNTIRISAASTTHGRVFEELRSLDGVESVIPMNFGGREENYSASRSARLSLAGRAIADLSRLVIKNDFDVLISIDRTIAAPIARTVAQITGRRFVLSAHYPFYVESKMVNRIVARGANQVIVHSDFLASFYRKAGFPPSRLAIIPNAVELERYVPDADSSSVFQQMGISPGSDVVVMSGRLSPFKGQDDLIKAAKEVLISRPDTYFLIAGRDTDEAIHTHGPHATSFRAILEQLIDDLGVGERVRLVGYYGDLPALLRIATVAAMPSWSEPFGLVALEAMAMAKPVVATRAGGVPEFIRHGETGLLAPPRDPHALAQALTTILGDRALAMAMGRRGRGMVEEFHTAPSYAERATGVVLAALGRN
jgi:glycosyltransferase involved in cell wall biosynthesis